MSRPVLTDLDFGGVARILGLPIAVADDQPVTLAQLKAAIEGLAWKDNVRVASVANINLAAPGASVNGVSMSLNDRFLAKDQTAPAENGIYLWNGAGAPAARAPDASTFDKLENAVVTVDEGSSAGASFRQSAVNGTLGTTAVTWGAFGTSAAAASETIAGIIEIATQAEVNLGTDDLRAITPAKLAQWSGRKLKTEGLIGDGSATSFNIDHNFGTRGVILAVVRNSAPYDTTLVDEARPTTNRVTLTFASAPAVNAWNVVALA